MNDRTATLYLTRGLPASGKTTFAQERIAVAEPGTVVSVSRDRLGAMLHGRRYYMGRTEDQITAVQDQIVDNHLRHGVDVIVDDTNLRMSTLRRLATIGWRHGADVEVVDFDVPVDTCVARDALRPEPVGEKVIRDMSARYLSRGWPAKPERPEAVTGRPYVPDTSLPKAILVDIDGTLALHGDRDPYDTSRYHEDKPNWPVVAAVRAMHNAGYQVVFCSGRHEDFRAVTAAWLAAHVGILGPLFMRPSAGRDDKIKLGLFDEYIRNRWHVIAAFDDRDRVVRAYRDVLGLQVWQVADGNF